MKNPRAAALGCSKDRFTSSPPVRAVSVCRGVVDDEAVETRADCGRTKLGRTCTCGLAFSGVGATLSTQWLRRQHWCRRQTLECQICRKCWQHALRAAKLRMRLVLPT